MTVRNGIGRRWFVAGSAALAFSGGGVRAQSFPSSPVRMTVAVGPGSSPDVLLRIVAEHLSQLWGQQAVVINQPGGAGSVAIRAVAATPPDGHSLYMALASNFIALPELQVGFPVDVVRDYVPIGFVGEHPMVIAASAELGVNTLPELVALAKQRKGELNVAAGNRGSILHLTGEWFRIAGAIDATLVHYPSASQAITDVLGGRVHVMIDAITSMKGAIQAGKIKPLAVASRQRLYNFPDLPAVADTFKGFEAMGWFALMAPPGTPAPLARRISDDLRTVLAKPELKKRFEDLGTYIRPTTPEELTAFIREQQAIWRPVIAETAKKIN
jgi:tripartite-type tricarboxylate transporter receptor subunit TctC